MMEDQHHIQEGFLTRAISLYSYSISDLWMEEDGFKMTRLDLSCTCTIPNHLEIE